jgi:hypothetical protein
MRSTHLGIQQFLRHVSLAALLSIGFASSASAQTAKDATTKDTAIGIAEKFAGASAESAAKQQAEEAARQAAAAKAVQAKKVAEEAKRKAAAKTAEVAAKRAADTKALAEQLKSEEADMLARAKVEAEERRADIEKSRLEADTMEAAAVAADAVREAADREQALLEDAKKSAAARRAADEKIIADAKAGETTRLAAIKEAEDKLKIAEARLRATEEELQAAEVRKVAAEQKTRDAIVDAERAEAERLKQAKAAEIKHLEVAREAEARSLADKIKRAGEQRAAETKIQSSTGDVKVPATGPIVLLPVPSAPVPVPVVAALPVPSKPASIPYTESPAPAELAPTTAAPKPTVSSVARWSSSGPDSGRVAVLLVMTPGKRGIRRLEPTADPVLCGPEGCYVSQGSVMPANFRSIQKALGPGNTWGDRAGACKRSLGCVFRNVDLAMLSFHLQPVDMKVMVHDWRERKRIDADSACSASNGRLSCTVPVLADDYRLWIVPEAMAATLSTDALDAAVRDGLQGQRASLN